MYQLFKNNGLDFLAGYVQTVLRAGGLGPCRLPREFACFTGELAGVEVRDARQAPSSFGADLAAGKSLVLTGPYAYVDGVYRYCQRLERQLVPAKAFAHIAHRGRRRAEATRARRRRLHHLLVAARGEALAGVDDPPDMAGLQEWLQEPTGDDLFLVPVRRLQRILTDMERARRGLRVEALDGRITLLPHVYVPADQSVPAMFADLSEAFAGRSVLDMGTGTGILALLAARAGAARVVATDFNPNAVRNARLNAERLGLAGRVEVRGPGDLFDPVAGERFDVILFNAPWIEGQPQSLYDTSLYDPECRVLDGFLEAAPTHLAPGGSILLQYSDISQRRGEGFDLVGALWTRGLEIRETRSMERVSRVLGMPARVFLYEIGRAPGARS